jgi:hypothetical protein
VHFRAYYADVSANPQLLAWEMKKEFDTAWGNSVQSGALPRGVLARGDPGMVSGAGLITIVSRNEDTAHGLECRAWNEKGSGRLCRRGGVAPQRLSYLYCSRCVSVVTAMVAVQVSLLFIFPKEVVV